MIGRPASSEGSRRQARANAPPRSPRRRTKLPTAKLKVPAGFNIEVYAAGMANARSLAVSDKGTVFVGSRLIDKVYAIVQQGRQARGQGAGPVLHRPNGIAFKDGTLYIAELSKVSKIEKVEDVLDNPPKPTLIYDKLPKDEAHGWKFIAIGPRRQALRSGRPARQQRAARRRSRPDPPDESRRLGRGSDRQGRSQHRRFDWHPETKQLYFTDNGRDWMSEDVPEDELNRVTKVGEHFGAPYCLQATSSIPNSAGANPAATTLPRWVCWGAFGLARHALLHRQHVPEDL